MAAVVAAASVAGDAGASAEVPATVSAAAQEDSAAELVAVPVVLVAMDSMRARGTAPADLAPVGEVAPASADRTRDGLAVQDSEVQVWRDPVLDDREAQDSVDQARQVWEVVELAAAWASNDPQGKRQVGSPRPVLVN